MIEVPELIQTLNSYLKPEDILQVEAAYIFSKSAHEGQYRRSGLPYFSHPVAVATILAQWHLDAQALSAALLHDVVEDTKTTKQEINHRFGKPVADLVDGVSKMERIEFQSKIEAQAENFRKMLLAMARDVRVILIKLADRLHNMRTLDVMQAAKRTRIARETIEIYAPIANRLGLNSIYQELEELSFRYLHPHRYQVLAKAIKAARGNRREIVRKIEDAISDRLRESGIEATVTGREKHLYSIYKKMLGKSLTFSEVYDIYGFRVIVRDVSACYLTLGCLHNLYKPIPGKFKDYIAIPKTNGYQSLHTTLFGPFGTPIEIQIRSAEMHRIAEAGVASHWLYKSPDAAMTEMQQKTHQWLQNLLEIQSESGDSIEFLEHVKVDLFPDEVYVFTPRGEIMSLPRGATAVDFAYSVHTDVGNHCVAAKINHELALLRTPLNNGDHVEILTTPNAQPNPAWLNYVVTGKARSHIRHYLKSMQYQESSELGERLLEQALKSMQIDPQAITQSMWDEYLKRTGMKSKQDVLADIGLGKRVNTAIIRELLSMNEPMAEQKPLGQIKISGNEGYAIQFGKCCQPIPGDPIIGYLHKGKGLIVHTTDCSAIARGRGQPERWVDIEWDSMAPKQYYPVTLRVMVANQRGVLAQAAARIAEAGSNINNVSMSEDDGSAYTSLYFTIQVENRIHLARIIRALRTIPEVVKISRDRAPTPRN
ncbi:MAG TPA: bifunctional (p)ppGpp synthetase/guanosine-3',5'-bis(diphosphate) 3'-pyrophosphohydrolase [Burkholderiales bacterium]|nr:bifunctional (p)ppGpp synthetase/guanosine-3',5'-bis(diphosphate) 3'-pyrophosphohydrolase [Burkholderiales bacterium]